MDYSNLASKENTALKNGIAPTCPLSHQSIQTPAHTQVYTNADWPVILARGVISSMSTWRSVKRLYRASEFVGRRAQALTGPWGRSVYFRLSVLSIQDVILGMLNLTQTELCCKIDKAYTWIQSHEPVQLIRVSCVSRLSCITSMIRLRARLILFKRRTKNRTVFRGSLIHPWMGRQEHGDVCERRG